MVVVVIEVMIYEDRLKSRCGWLRLFSFNFSYYGSTDIVKINIFFTLTPFNIAILGQIEISQT